ncbi:hypothetical protein C8R45DRAFT_1218287 [Mycena sanguinolenta]|nr:hypothetical protein C8R45DRAFT_1218287 [Mycena sanguinolenta]
MPALPSPHPPPHHPTALALQRAPMHERDMRSLRDTPRLAHACGVVFPSGQVARDHNGCARKQRHPIVPDDVLSQWRLLLHCSLDTRIFAPSSSFFYAFNNLRGLGPSLNTCRRFAAMACADSALIQELVDLPSAKPRLVRASNHAGPADPNVSIASWKILSEHKHNRTPSSTRSPTSGDSSRPLLRNSPTIAAVREFTAEVGKTGAWNGVPVEGFVVRTQVSSPSTPFSRSVPPYPPGSSFFFKVKFDEPYMMYRDWREVTKMLLSMRGKAKKGKDTDGMSVDELPKTKMRRAKTTVYARWVVQEIRRDPAAFAEYNENKGIVAVRERLLAYLASEKGKKALKSAPSEREEKAPEKTQAKSFTKTIVVPVAIPGCGKTAVAVALSHLFGFGHTQSDDVKAKKTAPVFIKKHDVVIADKSEQSPRATPPSPARRAPIRPPPLPQLAHQLPAPRLGVPPLRPAHPGARREPPHFAPERRRAARGRAVGETEPRAPSEVDEMPFADGLEANVRRAINE